MPSCDIDNVCEIQVKLIWNSVSNFPSWLCHNDMAWGPENVAGARTSQKKQWKLPRRARKMVECFSEKTADRSLCWIFVISQRSAEPKIQSFPRWKPWVLHSTGWMLQFWAPPQSEKWHLFLVGRLAQCWVMGSDASWDAPYDLTKFECSLPSSYEKTRDWLSTLWMWSTPIFSWLLGGFGCDQICMGSTTKSSCT